MKFTASAPGKLLLLGDHAVVYGRPCLVTAVDLRYRVSVERLPGDQIEISTPELMVRQVVRQVSVAEIGTALPRDTAFVEAAAARLFTYAGARSGLRIETSGQRLSYGLGSSSAVTVATVAALARCMEVDLPLHDCLRVAYQAVLDVQGKGSGFDVAAAVYGGTLCYNLTGLRVEPLDIGDLPLVIGYSGAKVGTVDLVNRVGLLRQRQPRIIDGIFDTIHEIVAAGKTALLDRDWQTFGELANIQQGLLDGLGVSSPQLARLIEAARAADAFGAKLSGAGGGDCMFAVGGDSASVASAIGASGGEVVSYSVNAPGVSIESSSQ
jgi:mevalonate kinase